MSWLQEAEIGTQRKDLVSAAEVFDCFLDQNDLLLRLAFLIAGDSSTAQQSLIEARGMAINGPVPFRDWLVAWTKWLTVKAAISINRDAICGCEGRYEDVRCDHIDHSIENIEREVEADSSCLLRIDPCTVIAELDPLARAVLVFRIAAKPSITDCAIQLKVSPSTVLAASCRAFTWLRDMRLRAASRPEFIISTVCPSQKDRWVGGP
jgi:hypothetical protein